MCGNQLMSGRRNIADLPLASGPPLRQPPSQISEAARSHRDSDTWNVTGDSSVCFPAQGLGNLSQNDGLLQKLLLPKSTFNHEVAQRSTHEINVLMALKCHLLRTEGQSRRTTEGLGALAPALFPPTQVQSRPGKAAFLMPQEARLFLKLFVCLQRPTDTGLANFHGENVKIRRHVTPVPGALHPAEVTLCPSSAAM